MTFLSPGTEDYVNLSKAILIVRGKVTKANGTDLDADEGWYCERLVLQKGSLTVDIRFSAATGSAMSLVCYGEFENLIQIDPERNVVYDYSG